MLYNVHVLSSYSFHIIHFGALAAAWHRLQKTKLVDAENCFLVGGTVSVLHHLSNLSWILESMLTHFRPGHWQLWVTAQAAGSVYSLPWQFCVTFSFTRIILQELLGYAKNCKEIAFVKKLWSVFVFGCWNDWICLRGSYQPSTSWSAVTIRRFSSVVTASSNKAKAIRISERYQRWRSNAEVAILAISVFAYFDSVHTCTCSKARLCRGAEWELYSSS